MTHQIRHILVLAMSLCVTGGVAAGNLPTVRDSLGDERVIGLGATQEAAQADAMSKALWKAVARFADPRTLSRQRERIEKRLFSDPGRYLGWEAAPQFETEASVRCLFLPRVYLTGAPNGKRPLLSDLQDLGVLQTRRVCVRFVESGIARPGDAEILERKVEGMLGSAGLQPVNDMELRRRTLDAIDRQKLEINPSAQVRQELRIALRGNVTELVVFGSLMLVPTSGAQFPTVEGKVVYRVWDGFKGDTVDSGVVDVKPISGASLAAAAQDAADQAGERVLAALLGKTLDYLYRETDTFAFEIDGWTDEREAGEFEEALRERTGVIRVQRESYKAGRLALRVLIERQQILSPFELLQGKDVDRFRLKENGEEGGVIRVKVSDD